MLQRRTLILLLAVLPGAALAQLRTIPEDAKRGTIRHVVEMDVLIDGVRERLAPGAQIRSAGNTVILPLAIPADAPVRYRRDVDGRVRQVWILSPEEATQRPQGR